MNITELARRMRVAPEELRAKLPELGFSIGRKAIKIDNRVAQQIQEAWGEMRRRERLTEKIQSQKELAERRAKSADATDRIPVSLPPVMTVRDLAESLATPVPRLMQELMRNGILASINERLDYDTAAIIAEDLGFAPTKSEVTSTKETDSQGEEQLKTSLENQVKENLVTRAPVIVVMGHVDHGKTKILDAIRTTNVMATESGGITQHIGAYQVIRNDRPITFIDTPGHEAFTVMRSRGAKVADIAILVVAADDGVQPQTKEAINIIQSAHLPFVVALNKIDREGANLDKVKTQLSEAGLVPEEWGGKTIMVPVSAKEGTNIDQLLDMLLLVTDLEKDRIVADPNRPAIGTVIESRVDSGAGAVATVLVQAGTLKAGDTLGVRGSNYGRVRAMRDWKGELVDSAPPSTPVRILGWKLAPAVGDVMEVPVDGKTLERLKLNDVSRQATQEMASLKHVLRKDSPGTEAAKMLNVVIRADVLGSLEAILGMLDTVVHEEVGVKVVSRGLGNLTDKDILDAEAAHAIVIGFNVEPTVSAEELSRDKNVDIRRYKVIYKLFDDILSDLQKLLPSETTYTELGRFEVMANFRKTDDGSIVGGRVTDGKLIPGAQLRVKRGEEYVGEGELTLLRSGRSDVKIMRAGQECGIKFKGRIKLEIGDMLEAYTKEEKHRTLKIAGVSRR